jgi:hypothetical protein
MARSTRSPLEQFFATSLKHAKHRAKIKNLPFDDGVTVQYLVGLFHGQQGRCGLTGDLMSIERGGDWYGGKNPLVCSMDRIDCTRGYEIGNIHLATAFANNLRGEMPLEQFRAFCKKVAGV